MYKLYVFLMLLSISIKSISQNANIVYSGSSLSNINNCPQCCNVFNQSGNSPSVGGFNHYPVSGGAIFDGTSIKMQTQLDGQSNTDNGTAYAIGYSFKTGYKYTITITMGYTANPSTAFPKLTLSLRTSLPNPNDTDPVSCGAVSSGKYSASIGDIIQVVYPSQTAVKDYPISQFTIPAARSYLVLTVSNGGVNGTTALINKITIKEEAAVSFTLSPTTLTVPCGSTTAQTFTVTNVNNTPGVTGYTWHLGAASNGWQYNGSAAPQDISTGTSNTISLTPVSGGVPGNVSATAAVGTTNYNTNTCAVSLSVPTFTISGPSSFCTSGIYSISGVPAGITVAWSVSPSGIVNLVPNGASVTASRTGYGHVTLTATFGGVTCNSIPPITFNVLIGGCVTEKNNGSGIIRGSVNFTDNLGNTTVAQIAAPQNTNNLSLIPGQYTLSASLSPGQAPILVEVGGSFYVASASGNFANVFIGDGSTVNTYSPYYLNVQKSQAITRNNCPSGQVGTSYTYTVAAGKYFSGISQADADSKATNEINLNGQSVANSSGSCVAPSVNMQNSSDGRILIQFMQGSTSVYSTVVLTGGNLTVSTIPAGTYTVTFQNAGTGSTHKFTVNGSSQAGTSASFPGIVVGSSLVAITISNNTAAAFSADATISGVTGKSGPANVSTSNSAGFVLSPNPAKTVIQVTIQPDVTNDGQKQYINIYDITGKIRKRQIYSRDKTRQSVQVDVSALSPGTYLVEVSDGKTKSSQKLIIQR